MLFPYAPDEPASVAAPAAGPVPRRLASALMELAARHGLPDGPGIAIGPPVTLADLAALTGTSIYIASRILASWEGQSILSSRRGHIRADQRFEASNTKAGAGIAHAVPACRVGWLADEMNVKDDAARDARATESLPRRAD